MASTASSLMTKRYWFGRKYNMALGRWFLPTNTENLLLIIAQGLIASPKGFSQYYSDVLEKYPGYIPIFKNKVPSFALERATSEDSNLLSCVAEINLKRIIGGTVFGNGGKRLELPLEENDILNIDVLFIMAPLPLVCISKILFDSKTKADEFISNATRLYGNVPLTGLKIEAAQRLFKDLANVNESHYFDDAKLGSLPQDPDIDYGRVYSFGGLLGSLFYFTKNGEESSDVFHTMCKLEELNKEQKDLGAISNYYLAYSCDDSDKKEFDVIYENILELVIRSKDCKSDIVNFLKSTNVSEEIKNRLDCLAELLIGFYRNTIEKPASVVFDESRSNREKDKYRIEIILLMLFHRDKVGRLVKYHLDTFDEIDYILFSMVFGMRDKFINLPKFIREYEGLQLYISTVMAQYAHKLARTGSEFSKTVAPPTLVDMLKPSKREFIDWASKQLEIQHCFRSVMPNEEFVNRGGKSTYLGVVLPKVEIDQEKYFDAMSIKTPENCDYNSLYKRYKSKK